MSQAAVTDALRLHVREQHRERVLEQGPYRAHGGAVREHHDRDPVDVVLAELAHDRLDVLPVPCRPCEHDVRDAVEPVAEPFRVGGLVLGDPRDHVVVELLHDPEQSDAGLALVWHGSSSQSAVTGVAAAIAGAAVRMCLSSCSRSARERPRVS